MDPPFHFQMRVYNPVGLGKWEVVMKMCVKGNVMARVNGLCLLKVSDYDL